MALQCIISSLQSVHKNDGSHIVPDIDIDMNCLMSCSVRVTYLRFTFRLSSPILNPSPPVIGSTEVLG